MSLDDIKRTLDERGKEWPKRGPNYHKFEKQKQELISEFEISKVIQEFDKQIYDHIENIVPIIVCGTMKSGTSFFKSLFDGHKNVFTFPSEPKFFRNIINEQTRKSNKELINMFLNMVLNPTGRYPFLLLGEEKDAYFNFYKNFESIPGLTKRNLTIKDVLYCFIKTLYDLKQIDYKEIQYFVSKTPENEFYYLDIKNHLKNHFKKEPVFFHIIRNPINNLDSLKKLSFVKENKFNFYHDLRIVLTSHFYAKKRILEKTKDYYVFKYEDITRDLQGYLTSICKLINIEFDKCMLTPTEFKKPLSNNSMKEKYRHSKPGDVYSSLSVENLNKQEIEVIIQSIEKNNLKS